jgi:hypothetical protein
MIGKRMGVVPRGGASPLPCARPPTPAPGRAKSVDFLPVVNDAHKSPWKQWGAEISFWGRILGCRPLVEWPVLGAVDSPGRFLWSGAVRERRGFLARAVWLAAVWVRCERLACVAISRP